MICLTAMGGQYGCCLLPETCDPALNRYHLGHKERGWLPRVVTRDQTQPSDGGALIPTTAGNTQIRAAERGRARAHGPVPAVCTLAGSALTYVTPNPGLVQPFPL